MAVHYAEAFKRLSRRYRRIRIDIEPLIEALSAGEMPGDQIQDVGHTVYKVRMRNTDAGRGKRGGYRVIYYLPDRDNVLLVSVYSKTDQSDISADQLQKIIHILGFEEVRQRGSHKHYRHPDGRATTVPHHAGRDISPTLLGRWRPVGLRTDQPGPLTFCPIENASASPASARTISDSFRDMPAQFHHQRVVVPRSGRIRNFRRPTIRYVSKSS